MSGSAPGRREVAYRLFAAEFDDAEFSYSESDEERAPNYVVTPTGARANRLFAVGVLTEVDDVNPEMVRGRLVDSTGAFVTYAGQYQPDALAVLERADPPAFFALSGKARTYEPDDGDRIYSSVRPETVREVDAETRDRWVVTAAERTLDRIGVTAAAIESGLAGDQLRAALTEAGVDERLADGVALALEYYGTTPEYLAELRRVATEAVGVVSGDSSEVDALELAPGEGGGDAAALSTLDLSAAPTPESAAAAAGVSDAEAGPDGETPASEPGTDAESESDPSAAAETRTETETEPKAETDSPPAEPTATDPESGTEVDSAMDSGAGTDSETETDAADGEIGDPDPGTEPVGGDALDDPDDALDDPDDALDDPDVDPGEFELDEEERREIQEEFGTDFSTADEVEPADIEPEGIEATSGDAVAADDEETVGTGTEIRTETGAAESESEPAPEPDPETEGEPEPGTESEGEPEPGTETEGEPESASKSETEPESEAETGAEESPGTDADAAGAADLDEAVVALMGELDDGDGARKDDVVAAAVEEYGADPGDIEDAIQNALMSGQCYEPSDDTLKRI